METLQQEGQPAESQTPAEEQVNLKRLALDILETLILAVVLFIGINAVSARVRVDGYSMQPTLQDGEFILVNKLSYQLGEVERGDIIVFHFPLNPDEELIKRVIGIPGDDILVENGEVFVNGQKLDEPYIAQTPNYSGEWTVDNGLLFVLGDNRNNSNDSKDWGLLPFEKVVGKASVIYWPPRVWQVIKHKDLIQ